MDTHEIYKRRERLVLTLQSLAAQTRNARTSEEFDKVIEELHAIGNDVNGFHNRTLALMRHNETTGN